MPSNYLDLFDSINNDMFVRTSVRKFEKALINEISLLLHFIWPIQTVVDVLLYIIMICLLKQLRPSLLGIFSAFMECIKTFLRFISIRYNTYNNNNEIFSFVLVLHTNAGDELTHCTPEQIQRIIKFNFITVEVKCRKGTANTHKMCVSGICTINNCVYL